ncbi:MAG: hypothetical protein JSW07_01780 [bacterium]|nr:MAG: hypothetical protein JSW07_01780 [bacterium]
MGITIHYRGSIKDCSLIDKIQKEMADICNSMDWDYQLWNEDQSKPFDAKLVHAEQGASIEGHIPLRGISIVTDPKNESLDLLFNPEGKLSSFMLEILTHDDTLSKDHDWIFVKTQYGSIDAHIAIVKLLRYLKQKYIPDLEVKDEGEYWETNDKEHLMSKRGFLFGKMVQFEKALSSIEFDHEPSTEEVVEKIEEIIGKMQEKSNPDLKDF